MQNPVAHPSLSVPAAVSAFSLAIFLYLANPGQIAAQSCTLICNDQITVVVPVNGTIEFFPEDIAEGDLTQSCPNGIFQTQVLTGGVWQNASGNFVFDDSHVGNSYTARLRDLNSGNSCFGTVVIQAAPPLPDTIQLQLCAELWKDSRGIKGATLIFQPPNPAFPYSPIVVALDTSKACTDITVVISDYLPGTTFGYSAIVPDIGYLNGVSVVDMCKISQHILGINLLPSPYAMIAADANKSGSITTFDLVEYRKLILGIYTVLPNNTSWRFIADYCSFPNPNNPFQEACQEGISGTELALSNGDTLKVLGIKIGDVDGDASLNGEPYLPPVTTDSITLLLPQGILAAGVPIAIPVKFDKHFDLGSIQAQFFLDPALARYDSISDGVLDVYSPSFAHYDTLTGRLKFSASGYYNLSVQSGAALFYIHLTPLQSVQLNAVLKVVHDDPDLRTFAVGSNCALYYTIGSTYAGFVSVANPLAGQNLRVQPPSPNPFEDHTFLEIEMEHAETATLEVADLTGRIVFSEVKKLPTGIYRWEIPGSALATGNFGLWRLKVGGQMMAGKLAKK